MKPSILLIVARHRDHMKIFPFGAATIYGIVKENGYPIDYLDCDFEHKNLDELISVEAIKRYDIIAISGIISCYKHLKTALIPFIRAQAPTALIIVGGYIATSIPELLLERNLCDVAFLGEANASILEFLPVFNFPEKWEAIKGVAFKNAAGLVIKTGIRVSHQFWDNIVPFYKHMDIRAYNAHLAPAEKYYPVLVEIGCPYKCSFCFNSSGVFNHKIRDAQSVIDEILEAKKRYPFRHLVIMAENLMSRQSWITEFCRLLDKHRLKLKWECSAHANTINKQNLKLVKRHGCYKIGIGFENFSQKILDNMNKKVKVAKYRQVIRLLERYNLDATGTCIFGYFGEDQTTVEENIRFIRKNYSPYSFFWIQPYPLTKFWNDCKSRQKIADDEKLIESLGDADDFVINATDFKDEELFALKRKIDTNVAEMANHRNVFNILLYLRAHGIITLTLKVFHLLKTAYAAFFSARREA